MKNFENIFNNEAILKFYHSTVSVSGSPENVLVVELEENRGKSLT